VWPKNNLLEKGVAKKQPFGKRCGQKTTFLEKGWKRSEVSQK
jgi:hypothetical protein